MADQSAVVSGYGSTVYHPGNPLLPTIPAPGAAAIPYLDEFGTLAPTGFELPEYPIRPPDTSAVHTTGRVKGFGSWFLDTIWATPVPLDFGDISDQKDIEITFHSTYRDSRSLDSVTIPVAGVSLLSPTLPSTLLSFNDEIFTFRAAQSGPQDFDDDIDVVSEDVSFTIRTLGRRVLMLLAFPEHGATEKLIFLTDIMRSKDGTEQAFSLRRAPRAAVRYDYFLSDVNDEKRTELETILFAGAPNLPIGIQYWWEARTITTAALDTDTTVFMSTAYLSIAAGETIVFVTPDEITVIATVLTINSPDTSVTFEQALGTALPLGTYATPIRFGHMLGSAKQTVFAKNLEVLSVEITTEGERDIGAVSSTYFDFHSAVESPARPILKERCMTGTAGGTIKREQQIIDSKTGRIMVTGTEDLGEQTMPAFVWINSAEQLYAWRQFLHFMRGSWGTFFAPTFQNDLPLNTDFTLGGNTFLINTMGIATQIGVAAPKRDLRIVTEDGTVYYRRITDVTDNGNGTETVTVDSVVGSVGFSAIDSTVISWMHLVRIAGDTATFKHTFLGEAELSFSLRTVKE